MWTAAATGSQLAAISIKLNLGSAEDNAHYAGEYVAVEKLEETYKSVGIVEQVWVYGNSFESTLVSVVVPVESDLMSWAKGASVQGSFAEVCKSPQANKYVLDQLVAAAKSGRLKVGTLV